MREWRGAMQASENAANQRVRTFRARVFARASFAPLSSVSAPVPRLKVPSAPVYQRCQGVRLDRQCPTVKRRNASRVVTHFEGTARFCDDEGTRRDRRPPSPPPPPSEPSRRRVADLSTCKHGVRNGECTNVAIHRILTPHVFFSRSA